MCNGVQNVKLIQAKKLPDFSLISSWFQNLICSSLLIFQTFSPLNSELNDRTSNYCKNADAEYKRTKEKTEELLQELNTLKEQLAPGGSAHLLLEEENNRLHNHLKAAEQDKKVQIFF